MTCANIADIMLDAPRALREAAWSTRGPCASVVYVARSIRAPPEFLARLERACEGHVDACAPPIREEEASPALALAVLLGAVLALVLIIRARRVK